MSIYPGNNLVPPHGAKMAPEVLQNYVTLRVLINWKDIFRSLGGPVAPKKNQLFCKVILGSHTLKWSIRIGDWQIVVVGSP